MAVYGFRSHKTFTNVTEGVFDNVGAYLYIEVTASADGNFYPNPYDADGKPSATPPDPIPLKSGETRVIPMAMYNFKSDVTVDVVAYRM